MPDLITEKFPKDVKLLIKEVKNKIHPWRLCAKGFQYRGGTTQKLGKGKKGEPSVLVPSGIWKCLKSSSKKDVLHTEEIIIISSIFFPYLSGPPSAKSLGYDRGKEFDVLIRGWAKYWNDIFKPSQLLDANLIKALIGSESGFDTDPKHTSDARGLMQILESTRKILGNLNGELKDHFVVSNKKYILDPSTNICAGIRWLFHKKRLASGKLDREASWEEAIAEYKSYLPDYLKNPDYRGMETFRGLYKRLSK